MTMSDMAGILPEVLLGTKLDHESSECQKYVSRIAPSGFRVVHNRNADWL
jgi:hypothetical protein